MGCIECRPAYRQLLRAALEPHRGQLCGECKSRFERNIFRVLDCKNEPCQEVCETLPKAQDHVCDGCKRSFELVLATLDSMPLAYEIVPRLVRGLDYYSRTVYEIAHPALGARDAICGGGRYDYLAEELGGPRLGAVGFAIGMEATLLARENVCGAGSPEEPALDVYIIGIGDRARSPAFALCMELRKSGITADLDFEARSPKAQMRTANKLNVSHVLIVGEDELAQDVVKVKDMATGDEQMAPRNAVVSVIAKQKAE